MTKPLIKLHNIETGEIIEREMNDAEFAQFQVEQLETQAKVQAETTKATEKTALLAKLGITADEAKLLLS